MNEKLITINKAFKQILDIKVTIQKIIPLFKATIQSILPQLLLPKNIHYFVERKDLLSLKTSSTLMKIAFMTICLKMILKLLKESVGS